MILGMSLQTFTLLHVLLSLVGIASGFVVLAGFLRNQRLDRWTAVFITTTALTSVTGFLFPFKGVTPGIKLGVISLLVLAVTIVTRYPLHLRWRKTFVITACAALYFNVFVFVVQSFEKIAPLRALAPTQKEPPFAIAQLTVLGLFIILTVLAARNFRAEPVAAKSASAAA
ncbi:MAG: hypothetical protein JOZ10_17190 [Acidobacteria bacterium]|nr:hypothetical protein [Acidobacteriota bacterium]MBV9147953.1 hypothetical protein [Acidobacteriota bacterium]MBV9436970.1 hypothetical protein [Acidobacteriota bacterium]